MSFEITGKIVKKYDIEAKTATFQTREFVIVTDETYPQYVKFQLSQERVNLIESFQENDVVKVSFDLRGREWQGKYFTNLNASTRKSKNDVVQINQKYSLLIFNCIYFSSQANLLIRITIPKV